MNMWFLRWPYVVALFVALFLSHVFLARGQDAPPPTQQSPGPQTMVPFYEPEMTAILGQFCDAARYANRMMADQYCAALKDKFDAAKKTAATEKK